MPVRRCAWLRRRFPFTPQSIAISTVSPSHTVNPASRADQARALWLVLCFLISCFFYGVGFNLSFALSALLGPLMVLVSMPVAQLYRGIVHNSGLVLAGGLWTALIMLQHLSFSISADTSFAPSIILAAVPLWAVTLALLSVRDTVFTGLFAIVTICAGVSAFEFLVWNTRAHAPLWDPNNYVSLLYLVWIPWLLRRMSVSGTGGGAQEMITAGLSWVFSLALLATHSRFAVLVLIGVVLISGLYVQRFGWPVRSWLAPLAGIAAAAVCYVLLQPSADALAGPSAGTVLTASQAESERLLMMASALQALADHGGLLGTGLYTFTLLYPVYRSPAEQGTAGEFVHNDFLQLALEGGVLLVVPMLLLCAWLAYVFWRQVVRQRQFTPELAFATAVGVALAHALVNFVFYVLPLTILIGALLGCTVAGQRLSPAASGSIPSEESWRKRAALVGVGKWGAVLLLVLNIAYLAIDALSYGVFSNQVHVPGATAIRADAARMLGFSRLVQQLNGRRGVPVLAEAKILDAQLGAGSGPLLTSQVQGAYRRAMEVDPWNPLVFTSYADFLRRHPALEQDAGVEALLRQALHLNPANPSANLALLDWYQARAEGEGLIEVIANTLQWCELMRRVQNEQAQTLLGRIDSIARNIGSSDLQERLARCRASDVSAVAAAREPTWMMRWLRDARQ